MQATASIGQLHHGGAAQSHVGTRIQRQFVNSKDHVSRRQESTQDAQRIEVTGKQPLQILPAVEG